MATESGTSVKDCYINLQSIESSRKDSEEVAELAGTHPYRIEHPQNHSESSN